MYNWIERFFSLFKTSPQSTLSLFYHEDFFLQVEIVPNENLVVGLTKTEKIALNTRKILPAELEQVLNLLGLERVETVFTGYGSSYRNLHKNCVGYGNSLGAIYYTYHENVVQNIWLVNHGYVNATSLSDCLEELGKRWNLSLNDWVLNQTVDLNDRLAVSQYLIQESIAE